VKYYFSLAPRAFSTSALPNSTSVARVSIEEGLGGPNYAIEEEAALRGLLVDEGLLDRVRFFGGPSLPAL
jgi:hypothetical protein